MDLRHIHYSEALVFGNGFTMHTLLRGSSLWEWIYDTHIAQKLYSFGRAEIAAPEVI